MTLTHFLIFCLATWRIASLLVREAGPFDIFIHIRELTGVKHDEDGNIFMLPDNFFAGVLSCVWCCSIWIAIGWVALWSFWPDVAIYASIPFGVSAGAILVDRVL